MSTYKILASDLDGTLLNSKGDVSDENLKAVAELVHRGALFVPSSGRTFSEIPENIRENPDIRYVIHSSGAVVYDKLTGQRISFCIPKELSSIVFDLLSQYECHITLRQKGRTLVNGKKMNKITCEYNQVWDIHYELIDKLAVRIDDFDKQVREMEDIEMISVFFHNDADIDRAKERIEATGKLIAAKACPHNIEISYIEAGKGNALAALADKLGISILETVAVGDSANDLPMILEAGLGLAMKNASAEVKAAANETVCNNDEHVVEYILSKYF